MISLREVIKVGRTQQECFDYVADFRTAPEWDATAFRARKVSPGPVGLGSQFVVRCRLPVGAVDVAYTITEFDAPRLVTLEARCWLFEAVDTIRISDQGDGSEIEYLADFSFRMPFAVLEAPLRSGMQRMGGVSLAGLRRALEDKFPQPKISAGNATADRLLWPGLALFSKLGFTRGRRHWNAISSNLRGKRIVITGASSGLGYATAEALAPRGAELVLVMRNEERAAEVVQTLREESGNERITYEIADLALMRDVDALSERLLREGRPIDVLVNNAGALFNNWSQTDEGLERSFALLLLSPWRLTRALHPLLAAAGESRVINVVSGGMYSQKLEVDKLEACPEAYAGATAYALCKRALTVVSEEWAAAWADDGIVVNAMHPGWADTPGVETALPAFHNIMKRVLRTPEEGADTIIWLAAAREAGLLSGRLFLDRQPRTTHLLSRTREEPGERDKLMAFLEDFDKLEQAAA